MAEDCDSIVLSDVMVARACSGVCQVVCRRECLLVYWIDLMDPTAQGTVGDSGNLGRSAI